MTPAPLLAFALILAPGLAAACGSVAVGAVTVADAWSRVTIGAARPGVVYLTIRNDGPADALIGLSTPVAGMPMLHETVVADGIASMPHAMEVPVPAKGTTALAPGGYHAMLMDLAQPLKEDETFPVTLTFRDAGAVTVEVAVRGLGARESGC